MMPAGMSSAAVPAITLTQLNRRIAAQLTVPSLHDVWVTAELSDFRSSGGHCYMELIEKSEPNGAVAARMRGIIWANSVPRVGGKFSAYTGRPLSTGLKVMVRGSVNHHPSYGLSFVISDIEPSFTLGDIERRRLEILRRLDADGTAGLNRSLEWPVPALRIAIISAPGAAGYGDFVHQLFNNSSRIRFKVRLFTAVMQGERTAPSVIAALEDIAADTEGAWDCVVIIRGGGATSDLVSFDNYDLASNVAQFPIPVIVGIGHERDVTVLDYVANMRVKTPTAAAEWLVARAEEALDRLRVIADAMLRTATDRIGGLKTQLAYIEGQLPHAPAAAIAAASRKLDRAMMGLASAGARSLAPHSARLDTIEGSLRLTAANIISRRNDRLDSYATLLAALSPTATLKRGYSITRVDGHAVTSTAALQPGTTIETTLADGKVTSTVTAG